MPTYKNNGTELEVIGGRRIEVGEVLKTTEYITPLPSTVEVISEVPFYNPIIHSTSLSTSGTYVLPAEVTGNYKISFYCATGSITVKLNSSNGVGRVLAAGETYSVLCLSRIVNNLIWTVSSGTGSLTIEKI